MNTKSDQIINSLASLFERAEKESLWFFSPYQELWFSPSQLRNKQKEGKYVWGPLNWTLRDPRERLKVLQKNLTAAITALNEFNELFTKPKPKIICFCGSLRFIEKFKEVEYQSVLDGHIALLPCCMFVDIEREHGVNSTYKKLADELHKRKIDICDYVLVLNVGGYIGDSTRSEIEYALSIGKTVKYLE